ncbi:MAG: divalent-cation tolerance protein CutA [Candidatus Schekmanbacteria bacterium]|nr:divalent-cation tolerance protein CutA [Candidatus Schekmanbacteria bacterium]
MQANSLTIILTSVDSKENALSIAEILLRKKLAACVNILPGINSVYFWEGKLCNENEIIMLIKTRTELFNSVKKELLKIHPYKLPEIISLSVPNALEAYSNWVFDETTIKK